eukprot:TRINITY_DN5310_c0_g2_i3.p1 TRINITY_DN5310_c0_g2~~TRINITY_DN5310_c0_g2_i3.p1  ORF type:complete len:278 (-),score=48.24 TRINITY_DN5310_c0_g2_i3:186-1019(-)
MKQIRTGHSLSYFEGNLILFGGIHDITHELDDLYVFSLTEKQWYLIDEDSAQNKELSQYQSIQKQQKNHDIDSSPNHLSSANNMRKKQSVKHQNSSTLSPTKKNLSKMQSSQYSAKRWEKEHIEKELGLDSPTTPSSPTKNLKNKKRKEYLQKKYRILGEFNNLPPEQELQYMNTQSPVTESMKNSLERIGNPNSNMKLKPGRLTDFGRTTMSKFLQPIIDDSKVKVGKKPCARDGHCVDIYQNNKLVIFGGDRHQMSFNDIHALDLTKTIASLANL